MVKSNQVPPRKALLRRRSILATGLLLMVLVQSAAAQRSDLQPDSARAQIRSVLRAFYLNLQHQNWEALAGYVLSPKLLERRGDPGDVEMAVRDRIRGRASSHAAAASRPCPASTSSMVDEAAIQIDGDWAEVSVPRCSGSSSGVDEFRLLYFEERWRFIYTDLFKAPPTSALGGH